MPQTASQNYHFTVGVFAVCQTPQITYSQKEFAVEMPIKRLGLDFLLQVASSFRGQSVNWQLFWNITITFTLGPT